MVKIGFDTQDDRVKPGMSVSASVVTDVKQDVLLIPNSALKRQGEASYVETVSGSNAPPQRIFVEVGLSNDTVTEIKSGLDGSETVVTQTITASANAQNRTGQATPGFRIPGLPGGGGGGALFRGGR